MGTTAGLAGQHDSNMLLDGLALRLATNEPQETHALLTMGVGLRELHKQTSEPVFLEALSAVVGLIEVRRRRAARQEGYFNHHRDYVTKQGLKFLSGNEAWNAVQEAVDKLLPSAHTSLVPLLKVAKKSVRPGRAS